MDMKYDHTMTVSGDDSIDMGDESMDMGGESIDMGDESIDMGDESIDMGDESIDMGDESIDMGVESILSLCIQVCLAKSLETKINVCVSVVGPSQADFARHTI